VAAAPFRPVVRALVLSEIGDTWSPEKLSARYLSPYLDKVWS
jgi:hypothetical protein